MPINQEFMVAIVKFGLPIVAAAALIACVIGYALFAVSCIMAKIIGCCLMAGGGFLLLALCFALLKTLLSFRSK